MSKPTRILLAVGVAFLLLAACIYYFEYGLETSKHPAIGVTIAIVGLAAYLWWSFPWPFGEKRDSGDQQRTRPKLRMCARCGADVSYFSGDVCRDCGAHVACPKCGHDFTSKVRAACKKCSAPLRCHICGHDFRAAPSDPCLLCASHRLCRHCGYDLTGNTSMVCPECGKQFH